MNIDGRYDNNVCDMLSLLQEALFRYMTEQEVDLSKFFQYFKQFEKAMQSLEQNFHPSKTKFSRQLQKIHHLSEKIKFLAHDHQQINLEPSSSHHTALRSGSALYGQSKTYSTISDYRSGQIQSYAREASSEMSQQKGNIKRAVEDEPHEATNNEFDRTEELNVIGEQGEECDDLKFKLSNNRIGSQRAGYSTFKRAGTAENSNRAKMSLTIDFSEKGHQSRPNTGKERVSELARKSSTNSAAGNRFVNERYRSLTKYEQTTPQNQGHSTLGHRSDKKMFKIGQKKSIYDFLEEEKQSNQNNTAGGSELLVNSNELYLKFTEKKKSKSFSRWSFKINKLL